MRIHHLEVEGFGPYRTRETVDFDAFEADGIFLISGKTGAGKSSILDAISYALYDAVPRYDKGKPRLRSDHCSTDEPTSVTLIFSTAGGTYRVSRSPEYERPKKRGDGMTLKKATAQLDHKQGDTWVGVAARAVDVGRELAGILGLSRDEFMQVSVLAQNRFQKFLLASSNDRERILRRLFGTRRFADYEEAMKKRSDELGEQVGALRDQRRRLIEEAGQKCAVEVPAGADHEWLEEQADRQKNEAKRAETEVGNLAAALSQARERRSAGKAILEAQQRLAEALEKQASLQSNAEHIKESRERLAAARDAAQLWPYIEQAAAATDTADKAADHVEASRAELTGAGDDELAGRNEPVALEECAGELSRELERLETARNDEARLPELTRAHQVGEDESNKCKEGISTAEELLAALPERIEAARATLSEAKVRAGAKEQAEAELKRIQNAATAAQSAERLRQKLADARISREKADGELDAARSRFNTLLAAHLEGYAAQLAAGLGVGEACPVCGATEHPAKAEPRSYIVTEDDVKVAGETVTEAENQQHVAAEVQSELENQIAGFEAAAGHDSFEALEQETGRAQEQVAKAVRASEEAAEAQKQLDALAKQSADASAQLSELKVEEERLRSEAESRAKEIGRITEQSEKLRGEYASVEEAAKALIDKRRHLQDLALALRTLSEREAAAQQASRSLEEKIAASRFDTAGAAENARIQAEAIAALEQEIRDHDQALAAIAAHLAEPALQDLPEAAPNLPQLAEAEKEAEQAHLTAVRLHENAKQLKAWIDGAHTTLLKLRRKAAGLDTEYERVHALAETLAGRGSNTKRMRLESYVLAAELEQIVLAANTRLEAMTSGRYRLEHSDDLESHGARSGLALKIFDEHTGRARIPNSLSGGETFLASLALALGLAEVVTHRAGGISLDTLFIDEGFGSLDQDTLEIAMATLDSLRAGGRTVGLISHVEAMKEQIPARLAITMRSDGSSSIQQAA